MRDYEYTTTTPDADDDDLPDECQVKSCSDPARMYVRFRNPKEYVLYCKDHAALMQQRHNDSTRKGHLS